MCRASAWEFYFLSWVSTPSVLICQQLSQLHDILIRAAWSMPMEAFPHFIQCRACFECSPTLFPSGVSGNRLTCNRDAVVGWQNDHVRKHISFGNMVSRPCLPGVSSISQQEALSGPNSLEDQKWFLLKFWGPLRSWCLFIISTRWMEGESCYNLNVTVEEGFVKWAGALSQAPSENVSAVQLTPELLILVASDCSVFCITVFFLL